MGELRNLERQSGALPSPKVSEPFSVEAGERRQECVGKKRWKRKRRFRGGRMTSGEKIAQAVRTEKVLPAGVRKQDCRLSHTRPVWRLEERPSGAGGL